MVSRWQIELRSPSTVREKSRASSRKSTSHTLANAIADWQSSATTDATTSSIHTSPKNYRPKPPEGHSHHKPRVVFLKACSGESLRGKRKTPRDQEISEGFPSKEGVADTMKRLGRSRDVTNDILSYSLRLSRASCA